MSTYLYKCPVHDEFEVEHSIKDKLKYCPKCKEEDLPKQKVVRLIAPGGTFVLNGGGWASSGYK